MAEQSRCADSFVDTIGTVLHLGYTNTVYGTGYSTIIKPRLLELGLRHVRDGVSTTSWQGYYDRINELSRAGIKFNFVCMPQITGTQVTTFASKVSSAIASFEGPNEWDLSSDTNWINTLRTYQESLYKTIKSNSVTAKFPVIGPAIVNKHRELGDLSAFLDYGNMHNYQGGSNPGTTARANGISGWTARASINSGSKQIITTEMGYHNALNDTSSHRDTPEAVAGKYMPRVYLEQFNRGVVRTYNYEFIDEGTDQTNREKNFGLLRNDGSPKPAFTALKNLISLLKDPGSSFAPRFLDYTLSGNTSEVHKTLLQKRDGRFFLILWLEKSCYNRDTKELITVPNQQVTLNLKTPISKAVTYLPNKSLSGTTCTISANQLVLNVPDHPLVVELTPVTTITSTSVSGTGLKGEYYDNNTLENLKLTRKDATVNFDWGISPPHSSMGKDYFAVVWSGQVRPRYSETYTFSTVSNGGVMLWVNGQLLINIWKERPLTENSGKITLTAGQYYNIWLEFLELTDTAAVKLLWSSPSQAKEIIPQSQLYC